MQRLLVLGAMLVMACSNPVMDEVMEMAGELEGEGDLMIIDRTTWTAVRYWTVDVPSRHVLSVWVKLEDGRWAPAAFTMSNQGTCVFIKRLTGMMGEGTPYRIEYRE